MPHKLSVSFDFALETIGPWFVTMSSDSDPEFSFQVARMPEGGKALRPMIFRDVLEVRQKVFAIREPKDVLKVFEELGAWTKQGNEISSIRFSQVQHHCAILRRALLHEQSGEGVRDFFEALYISSPLPVKFARQGNHCVVFARCDNIKEALRASVLLAQLDGSRWQKCQRKDCGEPFALKATSKRKKLYCSLRCARLQATRNYNDKKAARKKRTSDTTAGTSKLAQDPSLGHIIEGLLTSAKPEQKPAARKAAPKKKGRRVSGV